jgi:hypothetical protein
MPKGTPLYDETGELESGIIEDIFQKALGQ